MVDVARSDGSIAPATRRKSGPLAQFVRRLAREKPLGMVGAAIFLLFLVCGVFADVIAPQGINQISPADRLKSPSLEALLGTDSLGRDVLSRILYGAQLSVIIGFSAAAIGTVISVALGILTGYLGGKVDMIIQRFVDAWMSFPDLVLLIVVVSVIGPGTPQVIGLLGLLFGIAGSRIVRGAVMSVRENMYVHAAQSTGAGTLRILWHHILPNVTPIVIVLFTTRVGAAILAESGLSFIGLGVPPPTPTWGGMLSGAGRVFMYDAPWLALAPGICLTLVVYAVNVFGDALRDLLDPRLRGAR